VIAALAGYALLGVSGALLFIPLTAGLLVLVRQIVLPAQDRDPDAPASLPPSSADVSGVPGSAITPEPEGDIPIQLDPA
jgi:hypothetical protein